MKNRIQRHRRSKAQLFLATCLTASLIAGCSSDSGSGGAAATGSSDKKEPVTLKIEVFDRGNAPAGGGTPDNNFWTQWIQKEFGDKNNIKLQFVTVPRNQEVDKLNILMSTGEAPDIVFTYDMNTIYNYVKSGGLTDLGPLIKEHGPNLSKLLGDQVLEYGKFSGKQYTIPAKRALTGTASSIIRKDWLDKLGLPVPTTTEEFYNAMKQFKEKDPGSTGGKVIPYGLSDVGSGTGVTNPWQLMLSFVKNQTEEQFYTMPYQMQPGFKDGIRFMNKMYNEKLISPDFALDKDGKKLESDASNGLVGALTILPAHNNFFSPDKVLDTLKKNVPTAEYVAFDPFTNAEGKRPKELYDPTGVHVMIPKTSKRAAEAIQYLDWMSKPEVLFALSNGLEGQHYTMEGGFPKRITTDEAKKTFYNNSDLALVVNGSDFGSTEKNIEAVARNYPNYIELAKQSWKLSQVDGKPKARFDRPIEAEIKYGKTAGPKLTETTVKSIMAKPADFDKVFDEGIAEYVKIGGQAIIDEKKAAYKEMKK